MTQSYRKMASIVSCHVKLFVLINSTEPMKDVSEDEQEDNLTSRPTRNPDPKKSKAERTEQLRKMMEDEGKDTLPLL